MRPDRRRHGGRPRLDELESDEPSDAVKVTLVVCHEYAPGLPARQGEEHVIAERLRQSGNLPSVLASHSREHVARCVPRVRRWRDRPANSSEHVEYMPLECASILMASNTSTQLLCHDRAQVFEWREHAMKCLKRLVRGGITKRVDEDLCVQHVLAVGLESPSHRSTSGEAITTPCIARVPSMSARWKTTKSSARSIVSVAVAAPSARCAALSFESGSR